MRLLTEKYDDQIIEFLLRPKAQRPSHAKPPGRRKSSDDPEHVARVERYAAIVARGGVLFEEVRP